MLVEFLLDILQAVIDAVIHLRPSWTMELPEGTNQVIAILKQFNSLLPVTETLACLALYVGLVGSMNVWKWTIKLIDWIADVIP